ncbi:MAG: branched-chain amino acid ABC transporter permease [Armatimonadota bacterium]|nr:MAG: branched-chain amino acid ABC transporter permease [Armatimonadota bacterium]
MIEFAQLLAQGIAWGSVYALIALGYTMVYGVLRLINFAHGDVYMVGAFIAFYIITYTHVGLLAAVLIAMAGCAVLGVVIERGAYRPLRTHPRLAALITAIGVSLLLENGGQLLFGPEPKPFPRELLTGSLADALAAVSGAVHRATGVIIAKEQILIILSSLVLMGALQVFVLRTKAGKAMRAVAADRDTASLMGINTDSIISLTFVIGSALAAAAGVLVSLEVGQIDPIMGLMPGLKAFVAAVLGGIGNIPGAMIGGVIMGVAECLVVGYISSSYRDAIAFAILIIILLLKPTGLTGKGAVEKV